MPHCAKCFSVATMRCTACSQDQREEEITWYCGKDCQKAHWKLHKTKCKLTVFYHRVQALPSTQSRQVLDIAAEVGKLPSQTVTHMEQYIRKTKIIARPSTLNDPAPMCMSLEVIDLFRSFKGTKETYMRLWKERVPKDMRDKCYTDREGEVPVNSRPFHNFTQDNKFGRGGEKAEGILIFAQDYDMLPFDRFVQLFLDDNGMACDPFMVQAISIDDFVEKL